MKQHRLVYLLGEIIVEGRSIVCGYRHHAGRGNVEQAHFISNCLVEIPPSLLTFLSTRAITR